MRNGSARQTSQRHGERERENMFSEFRNTHRHKYCNIRMYYIYEKIIQHYLPLALLSLPILCFCFDSRKDDKHSITILKSRRVVPLVNSTSCSFSASCPFLFSLWCSSSCLVSSFNCRCQVSINFTFAVCLPCHAAARARPDVRTS